MPEIRLKGKELDRLLIIERVKERLLTQEEASGCLGLSSRQIRRLVERVRNEGALGIKSRHKGGNRLFSDEFKKHVLGIVHKRYADFGPTLACEKLQSHDGVRINKETLRQWMMAEGLWKGRKRKKARIHQSRERRPRFGEL